MWLCVVYGLRRGRARRGQWETFAVAPRKIVACFVTATHSGRPNSDDVPPGNCPPRAPPHFSPTISHIPIENSFIRRRALCSVPPIFQAEILQRTCHSSVSCCPECPLLRLLSSKAAIIVVARVGHWTASESTPVTSMATSPPGGPGQQTRSIDPYCTRCGDFSA